MSRFDLLKSLLRSAAQAGAEGLSKLPPWAGAKKLLKDLRERQAVASDAMIGAAIGRAEGFAATTAMIHDGRILVSASLEDGAELDFSIKPDAVRFAPRGAKEVVFSVEPPELVSNQHVRTAVGLVAGVIARALFGPALAPATSDEALTEREGARIRCDLRTVPAVRTAVERGGPTAMVLDLLTVESIALEDKALRMKVGIPLPVG